MRDFVQSPVCNDMNYIRCVLEEWECMGGSFQSSRLLQNFDSLSLESRCMSQEALRSKPLGRCKETGICAPTAKSCSRGLWTNLDDDCQVKDQIFGRCGSRCSWSPDSCSPDELWVFPSTGCTCDKVQVGACEKDNILYCAVSPDACDDEANWMSPIEAGECFMCKDPILTPTTSPPTASPVVQRASIPRASIPESNRPLGETEEDSKDGGAAVGEIIGGFFGAGTVLLALLFGGIYMIRKRKAKQTEEALSQMRTMDLDSSLT